MAQLAPSSGEKQRWEQQRSTIPPQLRHLAQRELEVAQLVLSRGEVTANDVVNGLTDVLSNSAIRSMLNRLVSKNILKRERRQGAFVYQPCTASHDLRERAIRKLSDDYFEGSILGIAQAAVTLLAREQQSALEALSRHLEAARVPGSSNFISGSVNSGAHS